MEMKRAGAKKLPVVCELRMLYLKELRKPQSSGSAHPPLSSEEDNISFE